MAHLDEPHPFALETAKAHYPPDRFVQAKHLAIELTLDFEKRSIAGAVTFTLHCVREVERVTFDAVELNIERVTIDEKKASFDASGTHLHVYASKPIKAGSTVVVRIEYSATPRRGLYFIAPDKAYPKRALQAWTQGQDEDSRYWFPCLDSPAQKCPTQVTATFPLGMTSLSNGELVDDAKDGKRRTMQWRLSKPHSPYLVTLVVGEFEVLEQKLGQLKLRTYFPKGRKADALRCVERTPRMVQMFERLTGQAYPWGDYAQIFVGEFIFGGMENTGATTLTDSVLHDERAHLDFSAEFLVAHELAHQWFGDFLTCRDWPHGWLNEGFATYGEVLWKEEADGIDEADHGRKVDLEAYLSEVEERYARPIVARSFDAPIDLFDRHLYEKGALVLHELRTRLGDADFVRVIHAYVAAHRHGSVETVDLARAVEQVTGRNIDRFFDEYVYRAGHPVLKVEVHYRAEAKTLKIHVKQTAEVFHLTLPVRIELQGAVSEHAFEVNDKAHHFELPMPREPSMCIIDGHRDLLATIEVKKPVAWWSEELKGASIARARSEAAAALGKDGSARAVTALCAGLVDEKSFWGARVACAKALAKVRSPQALAGLLAAVNVKHPKVRRGVIGALGAFRGEKGAVEALLRVCVKGDKSVLVEAEAARSLGKTRDPRAFEAIVPMLKRPAHVDGIRVGALDGLAELQDPRGWAVAAAAAAYGQPPTGRRAATMAIAKLAEVAGKKTQTVDMLAQLLRDPGFRVRMTVPDAAQALGDERLIEALTTTPLTDGREQRSAREAVRALRGKTPGKELASVRSELDALKGEMRALKEKVERPKVKKSE